MRYIKIALMSVVFVFLMVSLVKNGSGFIQNMRFYNGYKTEYEKTLKKNIELKSQKIRKTDPQELEKTIRNKLGLLRDNEIAVIVPYPTPTDPAQISPTPQIYQRWITLFFH